MIDITKQYQTRNGREVRIYATDGGGEYSVHGAIKYDDGWRPSYWLAKGTTFEDNEQCLDDLIEVQPTHFIPISTLGEPNNAET